MKKIKEDALGARLFERKLDENERYKQWEATGGNGNGGQSWATGTKEATGGNGNDGQSFLGITYAEIIGRIQMFNDSYGEIGQGNCPETVRKIP